MRLGLSTDISSRWYAHTDTGHIDSMLDGWASWQCYDGFQILLGQTQGPLLAHEIGPGGIRHANGRSSFLYRLLSPSKSNDWNLVGEPTESVYYELMVGQGYNTGDPILKETGNHFAIAETTGGI